MTSRWVLNASPIISLARIGLERLPVELADTVVVPAAVETEIMAGPEGDAARNALLSGTFSIIQVQARDEIIAWDLGVGETAVLSYALSNPGWEAILDDSAARKCARSFAIPYKGTLAIVITAKQRGLIPSAADTLRSLQAVGMRLEDEIIRKALLDTVHEDW